MEILQRFFHRARETRSSEEFERLKEEYRKSVVVIAESLVKVLNESVESGKPFMSFKVIVSGKGEVFSLGSGRYIVEVAEQEGIEFPRLLIDALKVPVPLGNDFKDLYSGGLAGPPKRYLIDEIIGEKNAEDIIDVEQQLVLYIDDHINTGSKAKLVLNGFQDHLAPNYSKLYFVAPVSGQAATGVKTNSQIIVGSENPDLFEFLKDSTLSWTT